MEPTPGSQSPFPSPLPFHGVETCAFPQNDSKSPPAVPWQEGGRCWGCLRARPDSSPPELGLQAPVFTFRAEARGCHRDKRADAARPRVSLRAKTKPRGTLRATAPSCHGGKGKNHSLKASSEASAADTARPAARCGHPLSGFQAENSHCPTHGLRRTSAWS